MEITSDELDMLPMMLRMEIEENLVRKDLTVSEKVKLAETIEPYLKKTAKERQGERTDKHPAKLAESSKGDARDKIATAAGIGRTTLSKAAEVVAAAEKEPEKFGHLVKGMDSEKISVNQAFNAIKKEEQKEKNAQLATQTVARPTGKYSTIVIDPPWPMQKIIREVRPNQAEFDYPTMSVEEIKAFPVADYALDNCHLYLWTTQKFLPAAFDVLKEWGFGYIFTMVWRKAGGFQPVGLPQYNCEFVLFGRRGNLEFLDTKDFFCAFEAARREHSRKPTEFYELVSRVSPDPRIDIFSRENHAGFDQWGNETEKFGGIA